MLLKKDYDTDAGEDEGSTSTGESDSDGDNVLDPNTQAYKKLPAVVKKQLEKLSGQVESLYDENKKLKEVSSCQLLDTAVMLLLIVCLETTVKIMKDLVAQYRSVTFGAAHVWGLGSSQQTW